MQDSKKKRINISFFRFQFSVVIVSTEEQWLIFSSVLSLSHTYICFEASR
jgi:hypothetical protein